MAKDTTGFSAKGFKSKGFVGGKKKKKKVVKKALPLDKSMKLRGDWFKGGWPAHADLTEKGFPPQKKKAKKKKALPIGKGRSKLRKRVVS